MEQLALLRQIADEEIINNENRHIDMFKMVKHCWTMANHDMYRIGKMMDVFDIPAEDRLTVYYFLIKCEEKYSKAVCWTKLTNEEKQTALKYFSY
jgi:hypothetical protein